MKKLLIALSVILTTTLAGCIPQNEDGSYPLMDSGGDNNSPYVIVIDSCEYVRWGAYGFAHKGNCKYCAERRRKEYEAFLEDIVIELY